MESQYQQPQFQILRVPTWYQILYLISVSLTVGYGLLNGAQTDELLAISIIWGLTYPLNILFVLIFKIRSLSTKALLFLSYLPYCVFFFTLCATVTVLLFIRGSNYIIANTALIAYIVVIAGATTASAVFMLSKPFRENLFREIYKAETPVSEQENRLQTFSRSKNSGELLGNGTTLIYNVINSLNFRASNAIRMTNTALMMIIGIVLVGGGASIGMAAFNDIQKIRDLELARKNLVVMTNDLKEVKVKMGIFYRSDTAEVSELLKDMNSKLANTSDYKTLLDSLKDKSTISWEDIAMRATIAALTLFLVQVFFQIYKFNQQQSFYLNSKAEVIELYKMEDTDKTELPKVLLEKLDANIRFGKDIATPIEQVINILAKVKDK